MKKFRLLAAMVVTVVMLFTVALAADYNFDAVKYDGSADTLTVVVKAEKDCAIDQYSGFQLMFDENVLAIDAAASKAATTTYAMTFYDYTGDMGYGCVAASNEGGNINVTKGSDLLVVVFNVLDKANVVGTEIAWDESGTFVFALGEMLDFTGSVTVEAAASEPTVVTGIEATSAEYKVVQGAENSYWGVWVGTYTVNAGGKALVKAKVDFAAADKSFETDTLNVEGSGDVVFDIAIIGVPTEYQNAGIATATLQ